jgi:phosphatidate cytidylyltransferase
VILVLVVIGLSAAALRNHDPQTGLSSWMGSVFVVAWLGLMGPMLAVVGHLAPLGGDSSSPVGTFGWESGTAWLFVLFGLVWSCDTGAYFVGRSIGKRKLHAQVSPGKTVEGYVGGIVVAALVTAALGWLLVGLPPLFGLLVGAVTAAIAQRGDLAKSMLKRTAGRKDSGTLIPGHGGVLDRIDSLLFAAPVLIVFAVLLGGMSVSP